MPHSFFSLNGVYNPPPSPGPPLPPSSKMSRCSTGLRIMGDGGDFVKVIPTKRQKPKTGKNIINPRVNISEETFSTSLTHENSDRVQPMIGPPIQKTWGLGASVNKTPTLFGDSLTHFNQLNKKLNHPRATRAPRFKKYKKQRTSRNKE